MIKNSLILALCYLLSLNVFAQQVPKMKCGTSKHTKKKMIGQPITPSLEPEAQAIVKIPVVFHVVMQNQNLVSRDSILAEFNNLSKDFLLLNEDTNLVYPEYKKLIGNAQVLFYLDTLLGQKGIIRVINGATRDFYSYSPVIAPESHLNVYIGDLRSSDGFVYSYSYNNPSTDAVFLTYRWIGKKYRLLTHETGHWMGLWHVFEGGCKNKDDGDDVTDTPPQKSSSYRNERQTNSPDDYTSGCTDNVPMYNNFMDYSNYRKMFTKGQVKLMYETLKNHRPKIWENSKN